MHVTLLTVEERLARPQFPQSVATDNCVHSFVYYGVASCEIKKRETSLTSEAVLSLSPQRRCSVSHLRGGSQDPTWDSRF